MIEFNNKFSNNANGGTEIIAKKLSKSIPKSLLDKFQIICDVVGDLDESKIRILWLHNTIDQIDNSILKNGGWKKFHKIVFISYHQMEEYVNAFNIPYYQCVVMHYGILPIKNLEKSKEKISLVYHPTPHRGLEILIDTFYDLSKKYNNLELKVFSSYDIYGFQEMQKKYERSFLYKKITNHPNIKNFGFRPNHEVRNALASSHIFAYPCIYRETFCLSLLEAMSAGCLCIHPNYGCLSETASNWTMMYDYHEDNIFHKEIFYEHLERSISILNRKEVKKKLKYQKKYVDYFYNWERKTQDWIDLLTSLENSVQKNNNLKFTYI